ncbi:MAG: phage major capsid protein [Bacilli bacterium]|nr:phage major capsid protein [Bacilli bacterium]
MDLLALMQKRSTLCDKQQALVNKAVTESRPMSDPEDLEFNNLQTEIDGLAKTIEKAEIMVNRAKDLDQPTDPLRRPMPDGGVQKDKLDDGGFKNLGEFLNAVKFGDSSGRIKNLGTSDVGILIPPAFSQDILRVSPEKEIVMPRANNIPAGDPPDAEFTIPYFQQGASGANGGVSLTWSAEAQPVASVNDPVLKDMTLKPQEVNGMATINNKTLINWQASGSFVQGLLQQAFVTGRDFKFLRGNGVGCPLGVTNAPGAVKVLRNTASTIKLADVASMLGSLLPESMSSAVWVASISVLPVLVQLSDAMGRTIFIQGDATKGIPSMLLGIPVHWTGKTKTLGNEGDLMLIDFQYYLTKAGSGPYIAISEHYKFNTSQTVFRITANMDGQPWVKDALLLEDGVTSVSPYVILK